MPPLIGPLDAPLLDATEETLPDTVNSTTRAHARQFSAPFADVLKNAARLLPHQAVLENFVHHNPWEMLQDMDFFEAQAHVRKVLSAASPGARLTSLIHSDPRKRANAALVELAAVFFDRGAAKWAAPYRDKGFLYFFSELEGAILVPCVWRGPARSAARHVLAQLVGNRAVDGHSLYDSLAEQLIQENLEALGTPESGMQATLTAMLWDMQGYASMFNRMEMHPNEAPSDVSSPTGRIRVRLIDFVAVLCILQRASTEALAMEAGCPHTSELGKFLDAVPRWRESAMDHEDV